MLPFALVRHANGKSRTPMPGAPENARRGCRVLQGKIAWSRYDIDTNSLLLAEWLVPREQPRLTFSGSVGRMNR